MDWLKLLFGFALLVSIVTLAFAIALGKVVSAMSTLFCKELSAPLAHGQAERGNTADIAPQSNEEQATALAPHILYYGPQRIPDSIELQKTALQNEVNAAREDVPSTRNARSVLTRQQIRAIGRQQCQEKINQNLPGIARRVRRRLARLAEKRQWKNRDRKAVELATR